MPWEKPAYLKSIIQMETFCIANKYGIIYSSPFPFLGPFSAPSSTEWDAQTEQKVSNEDKRRHLRYRKPQTHSRYPKDSK